MRPKALLAFTPIALLTCTAGALAAKDEAAAALRALQTKVKTFRVLDFRTTPGEIRLQAEESLTAEKLRGVEFDDSPPVIGQPSKPYDPGQVDGCPPGRAPYVARGIKPFRLREFTCEFNYGGWHNFNMMEYAATHGFGVIYPYVMNERSHFPKDTRWLAWGSFVDWGKFFSDHQIPWGRYDKLAELDVVKALLDSGKVWNPSPGTLGMLDLEHGGCLSPEELRKQEWYPKDVSEPERKAFEDGYYKGYLLTYLAPVEALRKRGWNSVGVYPQPYGSGWYALLGLAEKGLRGEPDPAGYWPWAVYGRKMVEAQDVLYPDLYVYYWSPQNVAYTLARIDFDMKLLKSLPVRKPCRPYFWPLLHGGDANYHWWNQLPLTNEDERAIFALALFSGCDGLVLWNWSEFDNHHAAPALWHKGATTAVGVQEVKGGVGADVMLKDGFELRPEGASGDTPLTKFKRYDVLAVTDVDDQTGLVKFQHIDTVKEKWGPRLSDKKPTYAVKKDDLLPHLRPLSEPVAGAVEGLALVKPFEYLLRHGEVKVDVLASISSPRRFPSSAVSDSAVCTSLPRTTLGAYTKASQRKRSCWRALTDTRD